MMKANLRIYSKDNIEVLGFGFQDIKLLLTMQAHWVHTAAIAEIKALTGAEVWATPNDARILEDGGFGAPHFGGRQSFEPLTVDRRITQGDIITLGDLRMEVHEHPGHTEGSSSYMFNVRERGRDYVVGVINMGKIKSGKRLVVELTYENVASDFAST